MDIKVVSSEREVFVKFDGITHFRCDRRELIGLQSWIVNRGRITPVYSIQFYTRCGRDILLEYTDRDRWQRVLEELDKVPFLNEWKIQDP